MFPGLVFWSHSLTEFAVLIELIEAVLIDLIEDNKDAYRELIARKRFWFLLADCMQ